MNIKDTNDTVQAFCKMIVSCSVELYNAAQDEITLEADLIDGRKISVNIKEVVEAENETADNWISCKDRLPSENTLVLCYARSTTGEGKDYFLGALAHGEFWFLKVNDIGHVSCPVLHWEVTHWQPLPESPKEDDDENS